jgi:hypothetical protein
LAVRHGGVGTEGVGDNNIQDQVAMLERELLNAATIVTGTTGYWASCRGCLMKTGSIMRPALMANVAVGYSQGERIQIMTAAAATHGSGARKPENFNLQKV